MAYDAARKFLEEVAQDAILQDEVGQALGPFSERTFVDNRCAALAQVAADHGYDVTVEEIRAAADAASDTAPLGEYEPA